MKKILSIFSIFFLIAVSTTAQTTQTPADPAEQRQKGRDKMREKAKDYQKAQKELSLNAEQKQKMKELRQQTQTKLKAVRSDASLSKEQKREQAKNIMAESDSSIKSILTPEQYAQWTEMKNDRREEGGKKNKKSKS